MSGIPAEILTKFGRLELLSCDVDGVMTDGGLYYGENGDALRKYNVKDGMGLKMLMSSKVPVAVISAGTCRAITARMAALGIEHAYFGVDDKLACLRALCDKLRIGLEDVAHIGDDVNDLGVLRAVGLPIAVADAVDDVLAAAQFVTTRAGGAGAVREICDLILSQRQSGIAT